MLIMNVRSYTYPVAYRSAKLFKEVNPNGIVIAGGMHATVALDEMIAVEEFDHICQGPGEKTIVELVKDPKAFPRVVLGVGAKSMDEWPMIDRTLWPKPASFKLRRKFNWPLEPECGWGTRACSDDAHQPRLPVVVRFLQRKLLHPQYGPPFGGPGDR